MKAKTTIEIKIGGRKLVLSSTEAEELYQILYNILGKGNRFEEAWRKTHNQEGRFQKPSPKMKCAPWDNPPNVFY